MSDHFSHFLSCILELRNFPGQFHEMLGEKNIGREGNGEIERERDAGEEGRERRDWDERVRRDLRDRERERDRDR